MRRTRLGFVATTAVLSALMTSGPGVAASTSSMSSLPPPTVTGHAVLWLTPAGQSMLPDPTQPLCDFSFTEGTSQYGYDSLGYGLFLLYDWSGSLSCQLQTDELDVKEQLSAPNLQSTTATLTPIGPPVEKVCLQACTARLTAVWAPYRCNPCHIPDPTGLNRDGMWQSDLRFTVKFQQPIAPYFQNTGGGVGPEHCPGGASDLYTYWCHYDFGVLPPNVPNVWSPGEFCFGTPASGGCEYAPVVELRGASVQRGGGAVLRGSVDPDGQSTSYQFVWGTSRTSLTHVTSMVQLGDAGHPPDNGWPPPSSDFTSVSATIGGLTSGVRYFYKLAAVNRAGRTSTAVVAPLVESFVAA